MVPDDDILRKSFDLWGVMNQDTLIAMAQILHTKGDLKELLILAAAHASQYPVEMYGK